MIYTLSIECVRGRYFEEQCVRRIEIDENNTLYDLHMIIQKAVNFDNDHLFDFYAGRGPRNQKITFTENRNSYSGVKLNQIYPLKNLKLYYLFDYGDHWLFEIKKSRGERSPEAGISYPRIVGSIGPNPPQYGENVE